MVYLRNLLFQGVEQGITASTNRIGVANCTFDQICDYVIATNSGVASVSLTLNLFASATNRIFLSSPLPVGNVSLNNNVLYNSHNPGYYSLVLTNSPFLSGPWGDHYVDQSTLLVDLGPYSAAAMALYFYSTATSEVRETNSLVDVGFHYPVAADTDSDGLYDYLEDSNGNGSVDASDLSDFTDADSDDDGLLDGSEYWQYHTALDDPDTDDDGLNDDQEVITYGTDPTRIDTDGDGLADAWEVANGLNPLAGGTENLVGWWKLDETSGVSAADASTNTNAGTLNNFPASPWSSGLFEGALNFDGTNDSVQIADDTSMKPPQISVSAWIRPYRNLTNGSAIIVSKEQPGSAGGYTLRYVEGGIDFMVGSTAYQYNELRRATNLLADTWYHLAGSYDGSNQCLYLNGILVAQSNKTFVIRHTTISPRIGSTTDYTPVNHFPGLLDDVRVFESGLSSNEVFAIYEHGMDADGDGLTTWEEYDYGTDPHLTDTDADGLTDRDEVLTYQTDPLDPDVRRRWQELADG